MKLEDVMRAEEEEGEGLGPNGGVMWAMEELEERWGWFEDGLKELGGRFSVGGDGKSGVERADELIKERSRGLCAL